MSSSNPTHVRRGPGPRQQIQRRRSIQSIFEDKARENLRAAEMLFQNAMYNASANRAYYAALHAAVAALANAGIKMERIDHEKVQAKFSSELVRRKKVYPGRLRSHLLVLQATRNDADYGLKPVSKKVAQRQVNKAREYLEALQPEVPNVQ